MKLKQLIQFNAAYYRYPTSVSRGFWAKYPIEEGLSPDERINRQKWIDKINLAT
jgi:hypothetical protein